MFRRMALVAALVWATAEAAPPGRIKLSYEVDSGTMHADVVETLEHDGRSYSIVSETRGRGILAAFGNKRTARGGSCRRVSGPTSTGTSVRLAGSRPRNSTGNPAR